MPELFFMVPEMEIVPEFVRTPSLTRLMSEPMVRVFPGLIVRFDTAHIAGSNHSPPTDSHDDLSEMVMLVDSCLGVPARFLSATLLVEAGADLGGVVDLVHDESIVPPMG